MTTQTFDDGSTISYDDSYDVTGYTNSPYVNNSQGITPRAANPGAGSWDDVLKYGFSRAIDYAVAPPQAANGTATLRPATGQQYVPGLAALTANPMVMLALVAGAIYMLAK